MIKPPFKAKIGLSGVWIEDAQGVTIVDLNPLLLTEPNAFEVAEFFARGANLLHERQAHAREISKKAGRPRSKKPSVSTLAKRKSRAKLKKQKPE